MYMCSVAKSCPILCDLMDCSPSDSSVHGIFQANTTGVGCRVLVQGIFPTQGLNTSPVSTALAGRFFTTEPPGKPHICVGVCMCNQTPGERNGNPLQYFSLGNPMDRRERESYSSGGRKESDTTERLSTHITKLLC